jgi:hypothetical protein
MDIMVAGTDSTSIALFLSYFEHSEFLIGIIEQYQANTQTDE